MTGVEHDLKIHRAHIAFIGVRYFMACPCGKTPSRPLEHYEVKEEMLRHPVSGVTG